MKFQRRIISSLDPSDPAVTNHLLTELSQAIGQSSLALEAAGKNYGKDAMNKNQHLSPTSTDRLITSLVLAIDEARLVSSVISSKDKAADIKENNPYSDKLIALNKEIMYLEAKLIQVRTRANN